MKKILLFTICLLPVLALCQVPTYYSGINFNADATTIRSQLTTLITTTHTTDLPYTSSAFDTWDAVKQTDENPDNDTEVLLFYGYDNNDNDTQTDYTRLKSLSCHTSGCIGKWTREHVYAKSIATPSLDTDYPGAGTDVHNLRACDASMNSSRNNRLYTSGTGDAHIISSNYFYPGDEWKGDVARIVMYMELRYPSQCPANDIGFDNNTYSTEIPDIFLEWNAEDPVSFYEQQRNTILEGIQGNRNPFIDNPYLATVLWGGPTAENTWGTFATTTVTTTDIWEIYPTPVKDRLYISSITEEPVKAVLYTMGGRKTEVDIVNDEFINVSNLQTGTYILLLTDKEQHTQSFKVVKE